MNVITNKTKNRMIAGLAGLAIFGLAQPALAHHALGGNTPSNFWEGFLSGLAHPIIGLDHLVSIVALGLLCAGFRWGAWLPGAFLLAAMAGTGLHLSQLDLPFSESAIALSVAILGVMLWLRQRLRSWVLVCVAAIAGVFHGYAYGEAIVGAGMAPLLAYLLGFTLIQYLIAAIAYRYGNWIKQRSPELWLKGQRLIGGLVAVLGMVLMTRTVMG